MTMTLEEAISKATKLLKLSESSNPHEAALAAQRAQEILDRYEIDRAALNVDKPNAEPEEPIERSQLDQANSRLAQWKGGLASVIARSNQCRVFQSGNTLAIIGRRSDVQKVNYLYNMLVSDIDRLTLAHGKGLGKNWCNQFRFGVVDTIAAKLAETKAKVAADMRAETSGTALVRVNQAIESIDARNRAVDLWVKQNMRLRTKTVTSRANYGARESGRQAGRSLNVNGASGALGASAKRIRNF